MLNPCELEIALFCHGLRIDPDASLAGSRSISRTRAGLGSGLELVLQGDRRRKPAIWVNAPVVEAFARRSPLVLRGAPDAGHTIVDERDGAAYPVYLPREPRWYSETTSAGTPMHRVGVLQGTYLGIYINPVCAFWNYKPALNCRFCTTGCNVGESESALKGIPDVVETCRAARDESGVTFVHLNGGFQGRRGLEFAEPYIRAIKEDVGLLVGVQLTPEGDLGRYDHLMALGVDHFSICLEFFDPKWFAEICPGKALTLGQTLFFRTLEYCAARMPRGSVSGEIIAGVEPIEKTLEAIDYITSLGAFPTVCIFRPTVGSDMQDWPPPDEADMRRVMAHVYRACRRRWIPIGAAPNIEVSIVVNPDDTVFLAEPGLHTRAYEWYRRAARAMAAPMFRRRLRPRIPAAAGRLQTLEKLRETGPGVLP
jgi:hypothetical protein